MERIIGHEMKVRLTFTEPILGTCPGDEDVYRTYIAKKALDNGVDPDNIEDEVESLTAEEMIEKGMTTFFRNADGDPILKDYQIKGFFKGACGFLRKVEGSLSSKVKSYKRVIDGTIFVNERDIPFGMPDGSPITIRTCQRPLRSSGPQGERTALAISEEIPAGAQIEFTVCCLQSKSDLDIVREWLNFGERSGIGQWRNSGKGRFTWEELAEDE